MPTSETAKLPISSSCPYNLDCEAGCESYKTCQARPYWSISCPGYSWSTWKMELILSVKNKPPPKMSDWVRPADGDTSAIISVWQCQAILAANHDRAYVGRFRRALVGGLVRGRVREDVPIARLNVALDGEVNDVDALAHALGAAERFQFRGRVIGGLDWN
ncbi:hypothetical protein PG990_007091 [Apiospora arundinis]